MELGDALLGRPLDLLVGKMLVGVALLIVKRLEAVVADVAIKAVCVQLVERFGAVALCVAAQVVVLRKGKALLVMEGGRAALHRA